MRIESDHPTNRPNFSVVQIGKQSIAFSYKTPIGYTPDDGFGWVTRENDWGPTTGRHLNELDFGRKADRIPGDQFEARLAQQLDGWRR